MVASAPEKPAATKGGTAQTPPLSGEQIRGIDFLLERRKHVQVLALAGPAGSGKSTMIKELARRIRAEGTEVTVAAMTNKAACVLNKKGIDSLTFHQACMFPMFEPPLDELVRYLYKSVEGEFVDVDLDLSEDLLAKYGSKPLDEAMTKAGRIGIYAALRSLGIKDIFKHILGWSAADEKPGVLIVDEASMMGGLALAKGREVYQSIICVGDEFQLPPVKDQPVFWQIEDRFSLTEIHRQAANSQPLELATALREGRPISMSPLTAIDLELSKRGMPVIVWRNATRERLTRLIRKKFGYDGLGPQVGETLICRNAQDREWKSNGLINNSNWRVTAASGEYVDLEDELGCKANNVHFHMEESGHGDGVPFRYGYAQTAHSSQSGQWPGVMIHQPDAVAFYNSPSPDFSKWLYTGITRAEKRVLFVADKVR